MEIQQLAHQVLFSSRLSEKMNIPLCFSDEEPGPALEKRTRLLSQGARISCAFGA